jgi:hypothetical protein
MHVVGISWKPVEEGFLSGLTIRGADNKLEFVPLTKGEKIAWTVKGPKRCIGRVIENRRMIACPLSSMVIRGSKCQECSALDTFDPCIRCTGFQCLADSLRRDECRSSEYIIYLAVFSNGDLKVGVSSKRRARIRWVEQGADYAGILTEIKDGKIARRIEHDIGKHPAVTMAVSGYQKKNSLMNSIGLDDANQIVSEFQSSLPEESQYDEVILENLTSHYLLDELDAEPLPWPESNQSINDQQLMGKVVGMKGGLLVTRIGHAYRVISLKRLIGYTLDEGISEPINSQSGLLDFI